MDNMATETLISVEEYLGTSYRPDREFIDGYVLERNLGERDHSELQGEIYLYLAQRRRQLGIHVFPEQRVQVKPTRFRVPDICVVTGPKPQEQIFTAPPFLCIEILSKDDHLSALQERVDDYLSFGVAYVWVVDPRRRRAWIHIAGGVTEPKDRVLRTASPEIVVPLEEIFAELQA